ncbi:transporter substrate-binding domain-containing protein [Oxalobacteraceae bacterium OTU3CAMAD1]|nr:transporter substrate-binding domain-containing protein [Oxalobacteraceae bacterium OTU3CAMAD1]
MHSPFTPHFPAGAPRGTSRRTALLALTAWTFGTRNALAAPEPMAYRYWDWGKTPKRDQYQTAALKLALQKTTPDYGPFTVVHVVDTMSTTRVRREIHSGKRMNVHAGPWRDLDADDPEERAIMIGTPVLSGLLGYRQLIVRRDDLPKFQAITTAPQLKRLVAGQGRGWVDNAVLRHNGYQVVDSGNIATLLDMLVSHRFDYLPISVVEADFLMKEHAQLADTLALVPGLMLYYPLPVVYYVSANEPRLAQRLEAGLSMAKRDGSLDALTARYFAKEIELVKASASRCFTLDHPLLPKIYASEPPRLLGR